MNKVLMSFLITTLSVFAQEKQPASKNMFYMTMGSEMPLGEMYGLSKIDRMFSSVGIGVRYFVSPEHSFDVHTTLYHHPLVQATEAAIGYLYMPDFLGGMYMGGFFKTKNAINTWFDKYYHIGARGVVGYQLPIASEKSSFLEVGLDNHRNLTVRSGLLF